VTKNVEKILSQLLDKKQEKAWSLGQQRQARGTAPLTKAPYYFA
jgi:hypothetical protein